MLFLTSVLYLVGHFSNKYADVTDCIIAFHFLDPHLCTLDPLIFDRHLIILETTQKSEVAGYHSIYKMLWKAVRFINRQVASPVQ